MAEKASAWGRLYRARQAKNTDAPTSPPWLGIYTGCPSSLEIEDAALAPGDEGFSPLEPAQIFGLATLPGEEKECWHAHTGKYVTLPG